MDRRGWPRVNQTGTPGGFWKENRLETTRDSGELSHNLRPPRSPYAVIRFEKQPQRQTHRNATRLSNAQLPQHLRGNTTANQQPGTRDYHRLLPNLGHEGIPTAELCTLLFHVVRRKWTPGSSSKKGERNNHVNSLLKSWIRLRMGVKKHFIEHTSVLKLKKI